MKVRASILITTFLFFYAQSIWANYCQDALDEFNNSVGNISDKRILVYDDLKIINESLENLKIVINGQDCALFTMKNVNDYLEKIRLKRIQTLENYLKNKINEEAGTDIKLEYDILTGKSKNKSYPFSNIFIDLPKTPLRKDQLETLQPVQEKPAPVTEIKPIVQEIKFRSTKSENGTSCSNIINQNETVNLENVRNQDGVGWCYAYAAADLLSFRLHKKISAVSLYNSSQSISKDIETDTSANGGFVEKSISSYLLQKNGLCLEEDLPSSDFNFCTYNRYIEFLRNLNSRAENLTYSQSVSGMSCLSDNISAAFPGLSLNSIINVIRSKGTSGLIENIYDLKCQNLSFKGIQIKPIAKYTPSTTPENLIKSLDETLERGDISSITYHYEKVSTDRQGDHASLVVGRRMNTATGKCEYLIRNSWGKECPQKENEEVACQKNCDGSDCRYSGHFWVASNRLKDALVGVAYLPPQ